MALPDSPTLSPSFSFDLILRGGTVVDGTGVDGFPADVGVRGGRIAWVGDLSASRAGVERDCRGRVVCPGFIDIHTHSDLSALFTPGMESSLAQGVTSEVVGNCGFSLGLADMSELFSGERRGLDRVGMKADWPSLRGFLDRVDRVGIATNIATLAGHGTVRKRVMGLAERPPDGTELATLCRLVGDAMNDGAIGISSGLEYVPGAYADVVELTALAKVAAAGGGFYATHLRDEGDGLEESVAEAIAVAEGASIALQLSHHKAERRRNWGKVVSTLATVDAARSRGLDILLDQYPYTAYQTGLATIALPSWAVGGTPDTMAKKLRDPEFRVRARAAMDNGIDWTLVEIAACPAHPDYQGRRVSDLSASGGRDPRDWVLDLLSEGESWVSAVHFAMSEDDVVRVLADPFVMIGSDAVATAFSGPFAQERPHPRSFGTFVRVLGRYVRETHLLTLPEAVRRMTTLPARRLGWSDRGRIAVGNWADLVVLDAQIVIDAATFAAPHTPPRGIDAVYVAGSLAWDGAAVTSARAGRTLRGG